MRMLTFSSGKTKILGRLRKKETNEVKEFEGDLQETLQEILKKVLTKETLGAVLDLKKFMLRKQNCQTPQAATLLFLETVLENHINVIILNLCWFQKTSCLKLQFSFTD